jgi:Leucine-rich repeat (LRR) protein
MKAVLLMTAVAVAAAGAEPTWVSGAGGVATRDGQGRITAVDLRSSWVTDSDLRDLAQLPQLTKLNLSLTRITDHGMKELKDAPGIAELDLQYAEQVTDEGMSAIRGWKRLRRLNLRGTKITDMTLGHLAGMSTLEALDIGFVQFTDSGLENLILLPNLKELSIGGNKLTDAGLRFLRQLPQLTYLDLSGAQRTDSGLWSVSMTEIGIDSLATLKDLRELRMGGSPVSARWLEKLKGLQKLERLSLQDDRRLGDDAVPVLASFKSLRWLDLSGSGVTSKGVADLRGQLPQCQILY